MAILIIFSENKYNFFGIKYLFIFNWILLFYNYVTLLTLSWVAWKSSNIDVWSFEKYCHNLKYNGNLFTQNRYKLMLLFDHLLACMFSVATNLIVLIKDVPCSVPSFQCWNIFVIIDASPIWYLCGYPCPSWLVVLIHAPFLKKIT